MFRKRRIASSTPPLSREELEALYPGQVWDAAQLAAAGVVITAYISNQVVVRQADGTVGTLEVQQGPPLLFFGFKAQTADDTAG